jgi:hypothetical protein
LDGLQNVASYGMSNAFGCWTSDSAYIKTKLWLWGPISLCSEMRKITRKEDNGRIWIEYCIFFIFRIFHVSFRDALCWVLI